MAEEDIEQTTDYIALKKQSPETALNLVRGLRNTISKLDHNPERHELDDDEELAYYGIRKHYYKNYEAGVRQEGYADIRKYGISFYKKDCLVMM